MKSLIPLFIGMTVCLVIISCDKDDDNCVPKPVVTNGSCIDSTLIENNSSCLDILEPVCGCDGVTYGNSCYATIYGGVTSYVQGECCD